MPPAPPTAPKGEGGMTATFTAAQYYQPLNATIYWNPTHQKWFYQASDGIYLPVS
jgi:hypothetical protein